MAKFYFYCVSDDVGVCAVHNEIYGGLKALFDNKQDAEKCKQRAIDNHPGINFRVHRVSILTEVV